MTRNKSKQYITDKKELINGRFMINVASMYSMVGKIFDDQQSRTCDHCEHRRESKTLIRWGCAFLVKEDFDLGNSLDFGCSKFERKQNEN